MKTLICLIYVGILITFLAGCDANAPDAQAQIHTQTITTTPSQTAHVTRTTAPGLTLTPTKTAIPPYRTSTPRPTPTPPPEARLNYKCVSLNSEPLNDLDSTGQLVLKGYRNLQGNFPILGDHLLDMATGEITELFGEDERGIEYSVSPDRSLLAIKKVSYTATGNPFFEELVITDAKGQELMIIPWEEGWSGPVAWLDNERLVMNISSLDPEESQAKKAASLMVLNTRTGERQILRPDFPEIYDWSPIPNWDDWGITMYDPSLERVVYLNNNSEYVLWNLLSEMPLAKLQYYYYEIPRWAVNGSHFVVEGLPMDWNLDSFGPEDFEAYLIDRDGQVTQLTKMSTYTDNYLNGYSWSPNGQLIAAWLVSPFLDKRKEMELALIDTTSGEVTDTCIRVIGAGEGYGGGYPQPPLWSPDGTQLVVIDWYAADKWHVILVDLENGVAGIIAEDMEPEGWLKGE